MALVDDSIATINATLLANLTWLDNAYGKIQRMKHRDAKGRETTFPGVYVGGDTNDYVSVLPDEKLGNYCYFEVSDPVDYENINRNIQVSFEFKISFWFDWRDLYPADFKSRSIEEVKAQILAVLMAAQYTRTVKAFKVYEDANSIFQNFTNQGYISSYDHKQIDGQFLMKPFGGLAFSGVIQSFPSCDSSGITPTIPLDLFGMIPFVHSTAEQVWPYEREIGGRRIYVKTFSLGSGADDLENLVGLDAADIDYPVRTEYRALNSVNGKLETGSVQLELNSGTYAVFTPDFWTDIFVRVYYTK